MELILVKSVLHHPAVYQHHHAGRRKKKIKKTREFIPNFHFKKRCTVKLDDFHRLEAIALV